VKFRDAVQRRDGGHRVGDHRIDVVAIGGLPKFNPHYRAK
jgi:hypothetical protein